MKTLVVDDEFTNRLIIQKLLSPHGEVQVCDNGSSAVDAFMDALEKAVPFHLVCLDMMMPVMDGASTLVMIRECEQTRGIPDHDRTKVILMTGLEETDSSVKSVRDLADGILIKPVRLNVLMETLKSFGLL